MNRIYTLKFKRKEVIGAVEAINVLAIRLGDSG
jgi:hypothetical protein